MSLEFEFVTAPGIGLSNMPSEMREEIFKKIDSCAERANLCKSNKSFSRLCQEDWHKYECFIVEKKGVLSGHTDEVTDVAWSPDGRYLVTM